MRLAFVFFGALIAGASLAESFVGTGTTTLWLAYGSIATAFTATAVLKFVGARHFPVFRDDGGKATTFEPLYVAAIVLTNINTPPLGSSLALALLCLGT